MQTIENVLEYLKQNPIIEGNFNSAEDVFSSFSKTNDGEQILFAVYDTPPYEGYATVLFFKDGKYYEVYGSHCSCYGLENQWSPEEIVFKELENRVMNGYLTGKESLQALLTE